MDEIVKAALAKWPHVPHCHGWLALDARGDWYLRDESVQRAGPFPSPKGSRIEHAKLRAFIERNYEADAAGRWFFQNGPQRVYVQLEAAPWVWRVRWGTQPGPDQPVVASHTGRPALPRSCWLDAEGRLYLDTDIGFGIVHSQDMLDAARALEQGLWQALPLAADEAPARFGFQRDPAPR
ncbi:MAG: DUF2946 family protein [Burkholderiaceae bacterium]|nr:DUF2946 family protein [Burkholderiaceae bacterium]